MREVVLNPAGRAPTYRLPTSLEPSHYAIEIEPDLVTKTFRGRVDISLRVLDNTSHIVFHALDLIITHVAVQHATGDLEFPDPVHYNPDNDAAFVKLQEKLIRGSELTLTLRYTGKMRAPGSMGGLYPSPYKMPNGEVKLGFETMMQPTMARAVFPCFDEPALKATFDVTLLVDQDLTCLSNMDVASEHSVVMISAVTKTRTEKKKLTFHTTPKMSTYLVVLVAGYFNVIETHDFHVPIRVWAAVERNIADGTFALEVASKFMKIHERNFGLEYPLPKLDLVAIPGHEGGMEHWGCVTFTEIALLLNQESSEAEKVQLAGIIAHELAHQWFGNIVTAQWWDSIWLNESFAEWARNQALTELLPDFNVWASFLASELSGGSLAGYQSALALDANKATHAIEDPSIPPNDAFDAIAYLKGCSLIRMMAEDLGVEVFSEGVREYLKEHRYGNATTEDLWAALSRVSGQDVGATMASWTQTAGYPLLIVNERRPSHDIVISQSKFRQTAADSVTEASVWPLTIHLRTPNGVEIHQMNENLLVIPTSLFKYKLNAGLPGFYRVSYPISRVHKLALQFSSDFLSIEDKIGIISDLGAIVATGTDDRRVRLSDFLDFLLTIRNQPAHLFVWREVFAQIQKVSLSFLFESEQIRQILRSVRFTLVKRFVDEGYLNFHPDDKIEEKLFRSLLFSQLKDHPEGHKKAREYWARFLQGDKTAINPNLRRSIFDTVALSDPTERTWRELKSIAYESAYIDPTDSKTPLDAFNSLGSSTNPNLIRHTLDLITPSRSKINDGQNMMSPQNPPAFVARWNAKLSLLRTLQQHAGGAQAVWDWLQSNWDLLIGDDRNRTSISGTAWIGTVLSGLATREQLVEVESFFADKAKNLGLEVLLAQSIDNIQTKAQFANADREDLLSWAERHGL
ncbi:peptidase family M1-domain-containing protein [Xylariales sp. PMI_506]|nr:peptidase family M1-domain-containing protein [Xylariales sp. PMI_506]